MLITRLQCLNPLIHEPKAQNAELNIQVPRTRGSHFNKVTVSGSASSNATRNRGNFVYNSSKSSKISAIAFYFASQTLYIVTSCPCFAYSILRRSFMDLAMSSHIYCSSAMEINLESIIYPSVVTWRNVQLWGPLHLLINHIPCFLLKIARIDHEHASHRATSLLVSDLMTLYYLLCSTE